MEKKNTVKIGLLTFFLLLSLIVIFVMGYFIYRIDTEKQNKDKELENLNYKIEELDNKVKNFEEKKNIASNTINSSNTVNSSNAINSSNTINSSNATNSSNNSIEINEKKKLTDEIAKMSNNKNAITLGTKRNVIETYSKNEDSNFSENETGSIGYYDFFGDYGKLDYITFGYDSNGIVRDITIYDRESKASIGTQSNTTFEDVVNFYKNTQNVQTSKEEGIILVKVENENENVIIVHNFSNDVLTKTTIYI